MAAAVQLPLFTGITQAVPGINSASFTMSNDVSAAPLYSSQTHNGPTEQTHPKPTPLSITPIQVPLKKKKAAKTKLALEVRRATSIPHMRGAATVETGALSPTADKKRNKLGYHRTSVACGHCRRRKIRCKVAADDTSGRCENCIRLKKECNFYPVEQEAQGQNVKSELGSNAASTSSPSSPKAHPSSSLDSAEEYGPYNTLVSATSPITYHDHQISPGEPRSASNVSFQTMNQHFPYVDVPHANGPWSNQNMYMSAITHGDPHHQPMRVADSKTPYINPEQQQSWEQRSMSVSHVENMQPQYSPQHTPGFNDRSHVIYPPPLNTSVASSVSLPMASPMTAPVSSAGLEMGQFHPQQWPYGYPHVGTQDLTMHNQLATSQWYPEPGALHKTEDDEGLPPSNNFTEAHFYPTPQGLQ